MQKATVGIRGFTPADAQEIARILKGHEWEERYVRGQLDALERLARERTSGRVLVAVTGESIAGFVSVELNAWNRLAQVQGLAVARESLRCGIGSRLAAEAERFALAGGNRGIYADTPVSNQIGRAFYRAIGYVEDYVMTRYYADNLDGVTLVKFFA